MSDLSLERARAHFALLERVRAGKLTGGERQAVVLLLERALLAALCDQDEPRTVDELDHGQPRTPPWWQRVAEAYEALVLVETPGDLPVSPPPRVGGADVHRLPRAR